MCGTCEVVDAVESVEVIENVYFVPECNLAGMADQLAKLNRRAAKLKVDGISFTQEFHEVRYQVMVTGHDEDGSHSEWWTKEQLEATQRNGDMSLRGAKTTGSKMAWYAVTVTGKTPKLPGWELIACLEPVITEAGAENLIKTVPGKECPKAITARVGQCDHCHTKRMRTETFVVKHDETGEYKVVGRQCIADFLGGKDPESIVRVAQWLMSIDELFGSCEDLFESDGIFSAPRGELTEALLAVTAACIDHNGWRSKASCEFGGIPTVDDVCTVLFPSSFDTKEQRELRSTIIGAINADDKYTKAAEAAITWAQSLSDDKVNDSSYLSNCRLLSRTEWISSKHFGLACSIVAAYQREMDYLKEQERKAKLPPSQHVGAIKERITVVVTCDKVIKNETDWGITGIHRLIDDNGNKFVWFASESAEWLTEGDKFRIKATVTKHDDWKGNKQTNVNRVVVVDNLNADGSIKLEVADFKRPLFVHTTGATVEAVFHIEEQIVQVTKKKTAHKWAWTVSIEGKQVGEGKADSRYDADDAAQEAAYAWQREENGGVKKW